MILEQLHIFTKTMWIKHLFHFDDFKNILWSRDIIRVIFIGKLIQFHSSIV